MKKKAQGSIYLISIWFYTLEEAGNKKQEICTTLDSPISTFFFRGWRLHGVHFGGELAYEWGANLLAALFKTLLRSCQTFTLSELAFFYELK